MFQVNKSSSEDSLIATVFREHGLMELLNMQCQIHLIFHKKFLPFQPFIATMYPKFPNSDLPFSSMASEMTSITDRGLRDDHLSEESTLKRLKASSHSQYAC